MDSNVESRPNFPVNVWVGLEIIKGLFDYTDAELLEQFHFNLLTAYAVGQENLGELTLAQRTIYYNRKRLLLFLLLIPDRHTAQSGVFEKSSI